MADAVHQIKGIVDVSPYFDSLQRSEQMIIDVDHDHPAVPAYYGCRIRLHPTVSLRWGEQQWNTREDLPPFDSDPVIPEHMPIVLTEGDPTTRTIAIWFDGTGERSHTPDIAAVAEVAGETICALAHFVPGTRTSGSPGRQVKAFELLVDRLEGKYMKGHPIVVVLATEPRVAYWIGCLVSGFGRYPCVKFVEADPESGKLTLVAQR